ncbi:hypothetical protein [Limosilactobacillus reuteri]|uniref:hypothetical protein n=1 Tax=Limosilactobacillus reuteri TaxID=1598 RepID=UPI002F260D1D
MDKIIKGQPDWDKTANANFDELKADNQNLSNATTGWGDNIPLTLMNGAVSDGSAPFVRIKKIGGDKFAYIYAAMRGIDPSQNDVPYIQLPSDIFNGIYRVWASPSTNGSTASWILQNNQIVLHSNSQKDLGTNSWFAIAQLINL